MAKMVKIGNTRCDFSDECEFSDNCPANIRFEKENPIKDPSKNRCQHCVAFLQGTYIQMLEEESERKWWHH